MASSNIQKIRQLKKDKRNHNRHTDEGMELLKHSVNTVGVIESITVSSDNEIISGNGRHEVMSEKLGDVEPIVIETDGSRPVILKRTDIKSNTPEFYKAAILANTTAEKNIDIDETIVQELAGEFSLELDEMGIDLDLGGGPGFDDDYDEDDASEQMETDGGNSDSDYQENIFPLAIAVTKAEKLQWEKLKKDCNLGNDTEAFKKLMAFARHADADFVRFIEMKK
jgi:hypothetical protein